MLDECSVKLDPQSRPFWLLCRSSFMGLNGAGSGSPTPSPGGDFGEKSDLACNSAEILRILTQN